MITLFRHVLKTILCITTACVVCMYERGNPGAAALVKRSEVNLQESVLSSTQRPGIELRSAKHAQKGLYLQSHLASS